MSTRLNAGFVPLVDAAPLIAAAEKGFARAEGLDLNLVRQASWASLRDHLNLGYIDCAQALAPLPIAAALGVGQVQANLVAPFVLSRGGNAITLSLQLIDEICQANGNERPVDSKGWARGLALAIRNRNRPFTLAMVYPYSGHNYEIRYWLASAGIHPDRDVRLIAIPPPLMVESLSAGYIDCYCVGEPWNSLAVAAGVGEIVATKSDIFPGGIEKVLAMPESLLETDAAGALMRSLAAASQWCDQRDNHQELAGLLARPEYLGTDAELSQRALSGNLRIAGREPDPDFLYFSRFDANRPLRSEALWVYAQMRRWGQVPAGDSAAEALAAAVYRVEDHARILGQPMPSERRMTVEACDGTGFDGESVEAYLQLFELATPYGTIISPD